MAAADPSAGRADLVTEMVRWTGVSRTAIVSVAPEMVIALLAHGGGPGPDGSIQGVDIQGEVADEALAQARGWRSMRTRLAVNCRTRAVSIERMDKYLDHDRKGPSTQAPTPQGWSRPSDGAYLADVVAALCGLASPGPAAQPQRQPVLVAQVPVAQVPVAQVPVAKAPVAQIPVAKPRETPLPPAPSVARTAAPIHGPVAQIAALPTYPEAEAALKALVVRSPLLAGLNTAIEAVVVNGRRYQRAEVTGFTSREDAGRFCARVRGRGGACFVR
jgi:hypothetical protein